MIHRFAQFSLNTDTLELFRDGVLQNVEPQTFRLTLYLFENRDRVISRNELLEEIWGGRSVSDWAISAAIKAARLTLGDTKTP